MRFRDRADAGRRLAAMLLPFRGTDVRVLGLARGGLRVAYEVARALEVPMDVWVSRRLTIPGRALTLGAVSEGGSQFLLSDAMRLAPLPRPKLEGLIRDEQDEVEAQVRRLRGRPPPEVSGSTVLLVDDGVLTGASAAAALRALGPLHPGRKVLATPVASTRGLEVVRPEADQVVCVWTEPGLRSVAEAYEDFRAFPDVELQNLIERSGQPPWRSHAVTESADSGGSWM
ncbi:phosphoribosyltransferase [Myxococcus landrumensis]|uniref:Phosphoribosyl transferase n=1 Tax=Myxococcus landrumensis TaxID=2813577 RepID=A0ABX7N136_9BACT|nr:phosphoribosyltransferase family protein [Myxococcus landrumus]QSQ12303.1 phosphoribosyl transferase [Myxococcus landrumus]